MNEVAKAIVEQTFHANWDFYLLALAITFVGSAIGAFLSTYLRERGKNYATSVDMERIADQLRRTTAATEETKAEIQNSLWWRQESWKRKYDLYHALILSCEEISDALWEIRGDKAVTTVQGGVLYNTPSIDEDAKRLLPHHEALLSIEERSLEKIRSTAIAAEFLLNKKANEALLKLRSVRTEAIYIANWSYYRRVTVRMDGIVECKQKLIEAAKEDLNINATQL